MKNTKEAFLWITEILERKNIPYKISGGFAARVYGVEREVADIAIPVIAERVQAYITFGPTRYSDENWDLELMTLVYEGQEIDIAGADARIFNKKTQSWELLNSGDVQAVIVQVYDKKVSIESLESLIAYKSKIARAVDLEDVKQLQSIDKK